MKQPFYKSMRQNIFLLAAFLFFLSPQSSLAATNLLTNGGAESGDLTGWTATAGLGIISGHDNNWSLTNDPDFVRSGTYSFDSSYAGSSSGGPFDYDTLSQEINLEEHGYSGDEMDNEPSITAQTYVIGLDAGSGTDDPYRVKVELRDKDHNVLATYDTGDQVATASWTEISHEFTDYGDGVRYIYFELKGRSSAWWDGNYGATFDDASVLLGEVSGNRGDIDSWKTSLSYDLSSCPVKLKLKIKGKHFTNGTEVTIGGRTASSVDVKSSKRLTAKFCLEKFSQNAETIKKTLSIKNPDAKTVKASKHIDLTIPQLLGDPTNSFDQNTHQGVTNIQQVLVSQELLGEEDRVGIYGPKTVAAVKAFQGMHGIPQTGNVGPKTTQAFQQLLNK